jgi:hypothetical protein
MVTYIWVYKESWNVNGEQFALSWMVLWSYMYINFLFMDILTTFVSIQLLPFCILTWVILNVASTINPFELSLCFFRWGNALPSHGTYQVLVQIWSNVLRASSIVLSPILFS